MRSILLSAFAALALSLASAGQADAQYVSYYSTGPYVSSYAYAPGYAGYYTPGYSYYTYPSYSYGYSNYGYYPYASGYYYPSYSYYNGYRPYYGGYYGRRYWR